MFCGPSATPRSPPPSWGKTSPSAPSDSSDPLLQSRSLGSPVVTLSSGSCTPQTLKAKNVSKLSTHLAIIAYIWLRASGFVILGNLTIELVVNQRTPHLSNSSHPSFRSTSKTVAKSLQLTDFWFLLIFPNQPCTIICSNEWVTCGPQETCKLIAKSAKTNVQTESR